MGFNYSPPPGLFAPHGLIVGNTISALGDSISARGGYFPVGASMAGVPAWSASTAYGAGNLVLNGGLIYRCVTAGTSAASGGPTGQAQSGIADGSASWAFIPYAQNRTGDSYLHWVDAFSLGALRWNMGQGYAGVSGAMVKALIVTPGSGYAQGDAVVWASGARGYLNVVAGAPTSVTLTNPGYATTTGFGVPTITTAAGSGCVISNVSQVAGTFGVPGCTTTDMVARLPDCVASTVDIFVVHGGTNDLGAGASFATITGNLKTCYETLVGAGKRVIAVPILPRGVGGETTAQLMLLRRVNKWIRAYARRESFANPSQVIIGLADPTRYLADGASAVGKPIGAAAAGNGAMTQDGLHPSPRGAQYIALAVLADAQAMGALAPLTSSAREAALNDGYNAVSNPGGNYLEAQPWTPSTAYTVGQAVSNVGSVYTCQSAGTSATSGGPNSPGGSAIVDGSASWKWSRYAGSSLFASGTQSMAGSTGGYTNAGVTDKVWTLFHNSNGGASGTITGAIESPWSDGQAGQRQSLAFALSGGSNIEQWGLYAYSFPVAANDYANQGIVQADLGVTAFVAEMEIEISGVANLTQLNLMVMDQVSNYAFRYQAGSAVYGGSGISTTLMKSSGEMLAYPNNGKLLLRTDPFIIPATVNTLFFGLYMGFDPSTSAASATIKINHASLRRAGRA
jgi:lysophospholipase L1-like esterase